MANAIKRDAERLPVGTDADLLARLTRASEAIAARIADGAGQVRGDQFAHCLDSAITSAYQVERQLARASAVGLRLEHRRRLTREVRDVRRMLFALQLRVKGVRRR